MTTKKSTKKNNHRNETPVTTEANQEELSLLYQRLVEMSPNGILVNAGEHIVFANQKAAEILGGATPADIVGRPMWDFIPKERREMFQERVRSVFEEGEDTLTVQTTLLQLDGNLVEIESTASAVSFRGQPAALVVMHDITDRTELQEGLKKSEERYRQLYEYAPLGAYTVSNKGVITGSNPMFQALLGFSQDELQGMPSRDRYPEGPDGLDLLLSIRKNTPPGEPDPVVDIKMLRSDGQEIWVRRTIRSIVNSDGEHEGFGTVIDVTAEKEAQIALAESEERYRLLFEGAPVPFLTAKDGVITAANPQVLEMFGYSEESLIGMPLLDLMADREEAESDLGPLLTKVESGIQSWDDERLMTHCDGHVLRVRSKGHMAMNNNGERETVNTFMDVTHEREMEEALRNSEERYRRMFDTSPVAHIATKSGLITNANPMATEMLGYSQEELINTPVLNLFPYHDNGNNRDDVDHVRFEHGTQEWDNEQRMVRKDGQEVIVRHRGQISLGADGERAGLGTFIDITLQKEAEEALRQSEDHYHTIYDHINDAIVQIGEHGEIIEANPAFAELVGYSREELASASFYDMVAADKREQMPGLWRRFMANGVVTSGERILFAKDGTIRPVENRSSPLKGHGGQPDMILTVFRDMRQQITDQKAMRESEDHYHTIYDHLNEAILQVGEHGEILEANRAFAELLGYTAEELVSISYFDLAPPRNRKRAETGWHIIMGGNPVIDDRRDLIAKDGTLLPVEVWAGPMKGREGKPDSVLTVLRDLRKQLAGQDALRRSEERYRAIYDSLTDGVVQLDLNHNIVGANSAFSRLSGYDHGELLTMSRIDLVPVDERKLVEDIHSKLLAGEMILPEESPLLHRDGHLVPTESLPNLLRDRNGDPEGVLVVRRDLRKQQQTQRVDRELVIMEERTRFAREIHDTVAQTLTALVNQLDSTSEAVYGDPKITQQNLDRSKVLAMACLTETRSALLDLKPMELKPGGLIEGIKAEAEAYGQKGLSVEVNVHGIEPINSDEQASLAIYRIVQEALSNSLNHGKATTGIVDLVFGPDDAVLQIVDDGEGFDVKAQLEKAKQGGRGFGLGIMEERALNSGGELSVISAKGTGARLIGRIPYTTSGKTHFMIPSRPQDSEVQYPPEELDGTCSVLLVDDHELVRHGTRAWLEATPDIDVVGEAESGEWAIAKAQELQPDIILMDIHMPTMDGIEATKRIIELQPETKVILLSVYDDDDHIREGLRAGAVGYLVKGASRQEVLNGIRTVFAGGSLVPSAAIGRLANAPEKISNPKITPRETEIWRLLVDGASTSEIASSLVVSPNTVNFHLRNLYQKLRVKSRTQAVKAARKFGMLEQVS